MIRLVAENLEFFYVCQDLGRVKSELPEGEKLRQLVASVPPRRLWFEPGSGHVEFVVHKAELGQIFSEYLGFPCHSFHRLLHSSPSIIRGWYIRQVVAELPSRLNLTPPEELSEGTCSIGG
jgi:hypothetical protein